MQKSSLKLNLHVDFHWIQFSVNILKNGGMISKGAGCLPLIAVSQSYIGSARNRVGNGVGRRRRKSLLVSYKHFSSILGFGNFFKKQK